jgi:AcrR family transcriptional regulator
MDLKNGNTEQIILEAAETLFLKKGYDGTRTTEIARRAGVNHAMLHYYFRTKDNLFKQIFEQKATLMLKLFESSFEQESSFFERIEKSVESHFDFLSKAPGLPLFIMREILHNDERRKYLARKIFPTAKTTLRKLNTIIVNEIERGTIRPVKAIDLLLNIASLNVFAFVAVHVFYDTDDENQKNMTHKFLERRKKNNIEMIINSLKL